MTSVTPTQDDRRAEARGRLTAAIEDLRSTDGWKRWIAARKRLRRYSFTNRMLIEHQCAQRAMEPPTRVMGFKSWLKFGRIPDKGSQALWIWQPARVKVRDATGKLLVDGDGKPRKRTLFKLGPVFDIQQTHELDGDGTYLPLEPPAGDIVGDDGDGARAAIAALELFCADEGFRVFDEEDTGQSYGGYYRHADRSICRVHRGDAFEQLRTLVHEATHALRRAANVEWDGPTEELIADAAAWLVLDELGINHGAAAPYIEGWVNSSPLVLEQQAQAIDHLADRLIRAINGGVGGATISRSDQPLPKAA